MSLFAASTASRHLRRRLLSNANVPPSCHLQIGGAKNLPASTSRRQFSSKLNGTKDKPTTAKPKSPPSQATTSSSSSSGGSKKPVSTYENSDPHLFANEMVESGANANRIPGTESLNSLTKEQRLSNFAMAGGLLAFVSYVFYYSLASVGGDQNAKALIFGTEDAAQQRQREGDGEDDEATNNPGFEEFLKEANEGRSVEEKRLEEESEAKGEARELSEMESSTSARLGTEGVEGSATEEEEREMARTAGFVDGEDEIAKKRPLWKRVVFFWRRE